MEYCFTDLPELVQVRTLSLGITGRRWVDSLDETVHDLAEQWQFVPRDILIGGSESLILTVDRADGIPAVLKIGLPGVCDCTTEATVLRIAEGRGYPRLIEYHERYNALLLEKLGGRLSDSDLDLGKQIRVMCQTLQEAWIPLESDHGLMTGAEKARWLADFIESSWLELDGPCAERTRDLALKFAVERESAFDPVNSVLVHGDAHSFNTLRSSEGKGEYRFVDPDGLFAEPALDLGISMRGWNEELLAGDPVVLGQVRCKTLAMLTGISERAIWQWGFMERVSTGLLLLKTGMNQENTQTATAANAMKSEGADTLAIADIWSAASISWNA